MSKEREAFEEYELAKKPNANPRLIFQRFESEDLGEDEQSYTGRYYISDMQEKWELWQAAKAQAVPEGFVLVPKEPSYKMWGGIARHLCRYAQMHDRYSPKSLKKYFDRFIGDIPTWLNAEVSDWESDHAFATADIGVFIYKAMIEAQHPSSTSDCPDEP